MFSYINNIQRVRDSIKLIINLLQISKSEITLFSQQVFETTKSKKQKGNFNRGLHSKSTIIYFLLSLQVSYCLVASRAKSRLVVPFSSGSREFLERIVHDIVSPGPAKFLPSIIEENLLNFLTSFLGRGITVKTSGWYSERNYFQMHLKNEVSMKF